MLHRLFPRLSIVAVLALAIAFVACGGSTASPPVYACTTGNYCAVYVNYPSSDFTGSPAINGVYTYIENSAFTCTGACAIAPWGFLATQLMLVSADNSTWVESGILDDGYLNFSAGSGTSLFVGVGTGGIPYFHVVQSVASISGPPYGFGMEIQRYNTGGSNNGYIFRYVPWYGPTQTPITAPPISVSSPNSYGLQASTAPLTHVEIGEFLNGTGGSTVENTVVDPPIVTSSVAGSTSFPAVAAGYPNTLYPTQLAPAPLGINLQFYHASEGLSGAPPTATGTPPFGAFLNFPPTPPLLTWTITSLTDPTKSYMVFTCCGGSFN